MQLVRGNGQGVHCTCKEEKDGEVPWVLHLYTAKRLSSFGELALMNNKPLQASVRAMTSGTLWALKREDFRGILTSEFSNLSSLKLLRSVDLLSRLTILQLSHIAESLSEVSFSEGQIIADRQIKALLQSVGTSFCPDYLDWFGNGATDSHSRNADQFVLSKFLQAHPADFSTTKLQRFSILTLSERDEEQTRIVASISRVEHLLRDVKDTTISTLATEDAEGLIVLNIRSYVGGVDLWQNDYEHDDDFNLQSMHDKTLEVVCISGAWHLGKLQIPTNGAGLIEYRCHPFWSQKYCPSHEYDNTARCCSCECLESWNVRYVSLGDGRSPCLECMESSIMDTGDCQLYHAIRDYYEGMNMQLDQQIPMLLVKRQALNEAIVGEKNITDRCDSCS